jgi:hypothetical protein
MNVKDEATGEVTSWAIFTPRSGFVPRIIEGDTLVVPGTVVPDGSHRMIAEPF